MRKFGICCIILGFLCMLTAGGWILYNQWEAKNAADASSALLQELQEQQALQEPQISKAPKNPEKEEEKLREMPVAQVSGYDCIGVLSIPALELELPVLDDWTYEKLKLAPCLYHGSYYEGDFVIAGHNYEGHFKKLSQLQAEDLIVFTDISGGEHLYEVALLETLPADATEAMITAGFDLSLYTCTPGGGSRVTVRCNAIEQPADIVYAEGGQ